MGDCIQGGGFRELNGPVPEVSQLKLKGKQTIEAGYNICPI